MYHLGISSYPIRWQRLLRAVSLLNVIIVLEGVGMLVWLLVHPSEPENRIFLAYSLERWILILVTVAIIFGFLFVLWTIKFKTGQVESIIEFYEQPKYEDRLLIAFTSFFVISICLMTWLPGIEFIQPYYARLRPWLLWEVVIVVQAWIFLIAMGWQNITHAFQDHIPVYKEKQVYSLQATNKYLLLVLIGASLVYLVLQVKSYLAVPEARLIGDSWSYLQGASLDFTDPDFFSERRPWAILLIYKILGSSQGAIEIFQLSLSTFAWLWLAWIFVESLENQWIKLIGFLVTLFFSLTPTVQLWNHTVLSESLTISVMILILAAFVKLSQQWKWCYLSLLILFFLFWMSIREANAYIAVFVAFALLIIGLARRMFRVYWVLSFSIGVIFIINYQLSSTYALPRWALPLAEIITHRILPEQEYLEYFSNGGMPITPELLALSGRNAISDNYAVVNDMNLKGFSKWLFNESRNEYIKFLLAHPGYMIESPLENIDVLLGYDYLLGFHVSDYTPALPTPISEIFYPVRWFWSYLWLSLFAAGFMLSANLYTKQKIYWVIAVFLLLVIPQLYLIWHGDALDVERHAVVMNVQFHLGFWWLLIFHFNTVFSNHRTEHTVERNAG